MTLNLILDFGLAPEIMSYNTARCTFEWFYSFLKLLQFLIFAR